MAISLTAAITAAVSVISEAGAAIGIGSAAAGAGAGVADLGLGTEAILGASEGGLAASSTAASAAGGSGLLSSLAYGSAGLSAVSGVLGAVGAEKAAGAQAASDRFNAQIAAQNAEQATKNAEIAGQAGEAQFGIQGQKGKAAVGAILAEQSASGVDVMKGSSLDVRKSAADLAQLNALTVRSNAIKEAYGYQTQAASYKAQGGLDLAAADNAEKAGDINAASTLLGSAANAGSTFATWKLKSGNSLSYDSF